jgi:hypothetical protein
MRDFLLLAKNLFVAATERGLRKHFAHFQATRTHRAGGQMVCWVNPRLLTLLRHLKLALR